MKKIALRKINIIEAYTWFQASKAVSDNAQLQPGTSQGDMWIFFKAFTDLLLPSKMGPKLPDTFMFDEERIVKLRADILDAINTDVCIRLLEGIQKSDFAQETPSSAFSRTTLTPTFPNGSVACNSSRTSSIPPRPSSAHREIKIRSFRKLKNLNTEQTTRGELILVIEPGDEDDESDAESRTSTRRTSVSSTTSSTSTSLTFPLSQSIELSITPIDLKLRRAIIAIIDDTTGNDRWHQSCSEIALELLRSEPNLKDLSKLESLLQLHLSNPKSSLFQSSESRVYTEFHPLLSDLAVRYASLNATQLFEVATSPRPLPYQMHVPQHALSDVAKQMAHIGILHWRVWAPLAYLVNPDDADQVTSTEPELRKADHAWGLEAENRRRRTPQRQNSMSESIPTGG
jgi:hypothetical protein